ncbi:MAG TPA: FixH family protein [Plasticicumulans sp.]|nr:FixH family protein [Plasticicumulans sp.]
MSAVFNSPPAETRWYRQFWPWVLLGLPASAVTGCLITIWIATSNPDGVVVDDYYKQGLAINTDQGRSVRASALGLHGRLQLDADSGRIGVDLAADAAGAQLPPALTLRLLHATRSGIDVSLTLAGVAPGRYEAALPALAPGRWNLKAEAGDWRLDGSLNAPHENAVALLPLVQMLPAER